MLTCHKKPKAEKKCFCDYIASITQLIYNTQTMIYKLINQQNNEKKETKVKTKKF